MGGAEFAFGQAFSLFAFEGHAVVGVEGHAAKDRMVGRGVAVAGLVVVLPIDGVEHPVTTDLNAPVAPDVG